IALRARGQHPLARSAHHHRPAVWDQLAGWRRGLFSLDALRALALADPAREFMRRGTGDLLLSSLGNRPRTAPRHGCGREDALSALREPGAHREALASAAAGLPLGSHGPRGVRFGMNSPATALSMRPAAAVALRVRGFGHEDTARWEQFVERCPEATFFHRIGWKDIIEQCFGHTTHYLLAERG